MPKAVNESKLLKKINQKMLISIIISCKDEKYNIESLLKDISNQKTFFDTEVIEIRNISPVARVRNMGAKRAKGEILVFIDCDIRLGNEFVIERLIQALLGNKTIGAVIPSIRIPENASAFERRYAKEIPHCEFPIVDELTEVGTAASAFFAISKDVFFKLGGFNENMIRGEDSEFSFRLRKTGYNISLAPQTWFYHHPPRSIVEFIKIQIRNGLGVSYIDLFYPHLNIDVHPNKLFYTLEKKNIFERIKRFFLTGFAAIFKMKMLLIFAKIFYILGYFYGNFKYRIFKCKKL